MLVLPLTVLLVLWVVSRSFQWPSLQLASLVAHKGRYPCCSRGRYQCKWLLSWTSPRCHYSQSNDNWRCNSDDTIIQLQCHRHLGSWSGRNLNMDRKQQHGSSLFPSSYKLLNLLFFRLLILYLELQWLQLTSLVLSPTPLASISMFSFPPPRWGISSHAWKAEAFLLMEVSIGIYFLLNNLNKRSLESENGFHADNSGHGCLDVVR